jgi:hypothetical protein
MRKYLLHILFASLMCTACAGTFTYVPRDYPSVRWNVGAVQVSIRDERTNVTGALPTVPEVTMPGGGASAEVRLRPTFDQFVQLRLAHVVSGLGPPVKLEISVTRARAEWTVNTFSETEKALVKLQFRVYSHDGRLLTEGVGVGTREFSSGDASAQELAAVFRAACNDAVDQYLGNEKFVRTLNAKL